MSDRLSPGQLRDLADILGADGQNRTAFALCRVADKRESDARHAAELEASVMGQIEAESATLPPHMLKLPGGAVVEVLSQSYGDWRFLGVPRRNPLLWLTPYNRFDFSSETRDSVVPVPRPAWLTDAMLADVQRWLDERGIRLEGQR